MATFPKYLTFGTLQTSVLLVIVYAAVFFGVIVSDPVRSIPKDTSGFNIEGAYKTLHHIATRPHTFNSHANDLVRHHILRRLWNITEGYSHAHVIDDLTSNATYVSGGEGVSFEGSNILVKVDGTDPDFADKGGVLFSAHFDSVSSAPGVTDDAIGVVTLIELVEFLTVHRTKRTAIFNINNGEEDGLKGAHAFLEHPWSAIPDTFLNLEGASAGGRPLVFRSSSLAPVSAFSNKIIRNPHGNVLSADAFSRGVLKSRTDFSVYNENGMEGIDFAFYQGRSSYHTKYDSFAGADGGKESLWMMMEGTRGAAISLLNLDDTHVGSGETKAPVYFDLFGKAIFIFSQNSLFIVNIVLLLLGPVYIGILGELTSKLYSSEAPVTSATRTKFLYSEYFKLSIGFFPSLWARLRNTSSLLTCSWQRDKILISFVSGIVLQGILVWTFVAINPFAIYARPYTVLMSNLSLGFLNIIILLNLPSGEVLLSVNEERANTMNQIYKLTVYLLLAATFLLKIYEIGGTYFLTIFNAFFLFGNAVSSIGLFKNEKYKYESRRASGEDITERTPLLVPDDPNRSEEEQDEEHPGWWMWILELLLVIPIPVILVSQIVVLLINALANSLADGSAPVVVYGGIALLSCLIVLPIAPFSFKVHWWLTSVLAVVFIVTTLYNYIAFPFSHDAPLKLFFQQHVTLEISESSNRVVRTHSTLTGATEFLESKIIPQLPSSWGSTVECGPSPERARLSLCSWDTFLIPSPARVTSGSDVAPLFNPNFNFSGSNDPSWMSLKTKRTGPTSALFTLKGTNTRSCKIFFDNRNITSFNVYEALPDGTSVPSTSIIQDVYSIPPDGLSSLELWSRTWDREFTVQVNWDDQFKTVSRRPAATSNAVVDHEGLSGRVSCGWDEYESGVLGLELPAQTLTSSIPAFEELLTFLPKWSAVSKATSGLAEASAPFLV